MTSSTCRTGRWSRGGPIVVDPITRPWYDEFYPSGAVAQLGARVNGIHEVMGSIPISSTNSS